MGIGDLATQPHHAPQAALDRRTALALVAAGVAVGPRAAMAREHGIDGPAIAALRLLLDANILPFWRRVCTQSPTEGYELSIAPDGTPLPTPGPRTLVLQARTTFFFARLARSRYGRRSDLAIAQRGWDFLTRRMADPVNGGWWTSVAPTPPGYAPVNRSKQLVFHAHLLLALAEYARSAPSSVTIGMADQAVDTIHARFGTVPPGDYIDSFSEDWTTPLSTTRGYNARLRLVDALTSYLGLQRAFGSAARRRLAEALLANAVALADGGLLTTPAHYFKTSDVDAALATYNADLQAIHQLRRARSALGLADGAGYAQVIDDSLRFGENRREGGLNFSGPPGQPADVTIRYGYAQAECLLATCDSWVRTGNAAHGVAFHRTLRWILLHQADWRQGDWTPSIPAIDDGTTKASPFHPGRAVLLSLELLE